MLFLVITVVVAVETVSVIAYRANRVSCHHAERSCQRTHHLTEAFGFPPPNTQAKKKKKPFRLQHAHPCYMCSGRIVLRRAVSQPRCFRLALKRFPPLFHLLKATRVASCYSQRVWRSAEKKFTSARRSFSVVASLQLLPSSP